MDTVAILARRTCSRRPWKSSSSGARMVSPRRDCRRLRVRCRGIESGRAPSAGSVLLMSLAGRSLSVASARSLQPGVDCRPHWIAEVWPPGDRADDSAAAPEEHDTRSELGPPPFAPVNFESSAQRRAQKQLGTRRRRQQLPSTAAELYRAPRQLQTSQIAISLPGCLPG